MGYSVHEWFDDYLAPKLEDVFKTIEKNEKEKDEPYDPKKEYVFPYDVFIGAIKTAIREHKDERFTSQLFHLILNPEEEDIDLIEGMKQAFNKLTAWRDGEVLLKLEYRKDAATTVVANFQDYESEE